MNFENIIGYQKEKEELMYICDMLKNEDKYKKFNVSIPKALLLYGSPGTGKTTMAKALIEESGRKCFKCQKNKSNGDFVNEIRNTFEEAKKNTPSIVFLDDMDKFAEDNLQINQNKEEFSTIQTCIEDSYDSDVFVLATANDIDFLPESLLRAGRLGRQMEIVNPNRDDTEKIIEHYLNTSLIKCELDSETLTYALSGHSVATIKETINEAAIYSLFKNQEVIKRKDFIRALLKVTSKDIETEPDIKRKRETAIHEAGHALISLLNNEKVSFISISEHHNYKGLLCYTSEDEKEDIKHLIQIEIALAGKAAKESYFNTLDTGASEDCLKARYLAREYIEKYAGYGFNYCYDLIYYHEKHDYKKISSIETKIDELLNSIYEKDKTMINNNKELLEEIVDKLLVEETLLYDDVQAIYNHYKASITRK